LVHYWIPACFEEPCETFITQIYHNWARPGAMGWGLGARATLEAGIKTLHTPIPFVDETVP